MGDIETISREDNLANLAKYERKLLGLDAERQALGKIVEGLKALVGLSDEPERSPVPEHQLNIPTTYFKRMTVVQGAEEYLRMANKAQTASGIARALLAGGYKTGSTKTLFTNSIRTTLKRTPQTFVNIDGEWHLIEWRNDEVAPTVETESLFSKLSN